MRTTQQQLAKALELGTRASRSHLRRNWRARDRVQIDQIACGGARSVCVASIANHARTQNTVARRNRPSLRSLSLSDSGNREAQERRSGNPGLGASLIYATVRVWIMLFICKRSRKKPTASTRRAATRPDTDARRPDQSANPHDRIAHRITGSGTSTVRVTTDTVPAVTR
jgi:hypothetical protein